MARDHVTSGRQLQDNVAAEIAEKKATAEVNEAAAKVIAAEAAVDATTVKDFAQGTAVAEVKTGGAVVEKFYAPDEIEELAGAGSENVTAANTLLPRLTILQALSPQINKKKVEFIPGAEIGDWCDVSVGDVFKESVVVIPCHFSTQYIQWKKNRGGFAGNLGMDAACLKDTTLNEKRQNVLPNGDIIAETATWFCLLQVGIDWRRVFLPFSSTGLKVSRRWHTLIKAEKLLGKSGFFSPPLFYRPWALTVAHDSNDQGDWFTPIPNKIPVPVEAGANGKSEPYKSIYHLMYEEQDTQKWLLGECKRFYEDARDNLVVGDMGADDLNDPANARVVGNSAAIDNAAHAM